MENDRVARIKKLLLSPKIKISEETLNKIATSEESPKIRVIVLLENVNEFLNKFALDENFANAVVVKSEPINAGHLAREDMFVLWEKGFPGPLLIGNFTLEQLESLSQWPEVLQIEESKEVTALDEKEQKGNGNDQQN